MSNILPFLASIAFVLGCILIRLGFGYKYKRLYFKTPWLIAVGFLLILLSVNLIIVIIYAP